MKTFNEFIEDTDVLQEASSGVVSKVRKIIGPGKTEWGRGTNTAHISNKDPDHISSVKKKLDSTFGAHTTDKSGRHVWHTPTHELTLWKHSDGHHAVDIQAK
jgi:hypothetical protein